MLKANYHTHLLYCNHANGHAWDYVEEAIRKGLIELGISDHAPILNCFMNDYDYNKNWCFRSMKIDTMYTKYLKELEYVKDKYQDKIHILSGFETEYLKGNVFFLKKLRGLVDYLNLGVHYFDWQNRTLNSYNDINTETIYGYLEAAIAGMKTGLFKTLVHPDLFMVSYKDKNGEKKFDEHCEYVSKKIIECAIENDIYLEINANGIKNSKRFGDGSVWLYPCREFWMITKDYPKLKILIGTDAHDPKDLVDGSVDLVEKFIRELGLNVCEKMEF